MNLATQRRVSVIALAAGIALLSGCASPTGVRAAESPSSEAPDRATPTPSSTPTPTASAAASAAPADLTFEAGSALDVGDWQMGWGDTLGEADGFTVVSPDDGNGSWSYSDDTTACQLHFYNGSISDLDMTQDDRAISDEFLATVLTQTVTGATRDDVTAHAFDDAVLQYPGSGTVDTRTIWGTASDGSTWLHSARIFGSIGAGAYVGITCPAGQDASAELGNIVQNYLRLIVQPTGAG